MNYYLFIYLYINAVRFLILSIGGNKPKYNYYNNKEIWKYKTCTLQCKNYQRLISTLVLLFKDHIDLNKGLFDPKIRTESRDVEFFNV